MVTAPLVEVKPAAPAVVDAAPVATVIVEEPAMAPIEAAPLPAPTPKEALLAALTASSFTDETDFYGLPSGTVDEMHAAHASQVIDLRPRASLVSFWIVLLLVVGVGLAVAAWAVWGYDPLS